MKRLVITDNMTPDQVADVIFQERDIFPVIVVKTRDKIIRKLLEYYKGKVIWNS